MNTPNKLTIGRIIATPVFVATLLIDFPYHYLISLILFIGASLTDMIDGKMARKYNLITDFGKFLDPLADKMLTTAAYLGFIFMYASKPSICLQMTVIVFIVLFREFMVSSIRLVVVSSGGKVIAANIWGKLKTVSQMLGIIFALAVYSAREIFTLTSSVMSVLDIIICILFWLSAVLCIISGAIYLFASKDYINPAK